MIDPKVSESNRKLARGCAWVMVACLGGLLGIALVFGVAAFS